MALVSMHHNKEGWVAGRQVVAKSYLVAPPGTHSAYHLRHAAAHACSRCVVFTMRNMSKHRAVHKRNVAYTSVCTPAMLPCLQRPRLAAECAGCLRRPAGIALLQASCVSTQGAQSQQAAQQRASQTLSRDLASPSRSLHYRPSTSTRFLEALPSPCPALWTGHHCR